MYVSVHAVTGAATALTLEAAGIPAALAVGASVLTHVILDAIPHHDYRSLPAAVVDLALAFGILQLLAASGWVTNTSMLWLGGFAGAAPDLEIIAVHWRAIPYARARFPSHTGRLPHPQLPFIPGILPPVLVAGVAMLVIGWV